MKGPKKNILDLLVSLLAEQEGVQIKYERIQRDEKENLALHQTNDSHGIVIRE